MPLAFPGTSKRNSPSRRAITAMIERMEQRTLLSAGDIDPTFGTGGFMTITAPAGQEASVGGMAVQPDGKVLVAVEFGIYTEFSISPPISCQVRRLLTDGSLDPTFGIAGVVS